jgi:hypothetical protein
MNLTRRRKQRPLAELSDDALRQKITDAHRTIERMPDRPAHDAIPRLRLDMEAAARAGAAAQAELDRRAEAEKEALGADLRRRVRRSQRSAQVKALDLVAAFAHPELAGTALSPTRLDDSDAAELLDLAQRRSDREEEPLDADAEQRYEQLVEQAAGAPGLFERKRTEAVVRDKLNEYRTAERRHPQADDLVAAVMADEFLFDGLRHRLRPDGFFVDEFGNTQRTGSAARIFEYDDIAALFVLVSLIAQNGGHAITIGEHGYLGDGLPNLPLGGMTQLVRNGYLTVAQEGAGHQVRLGERACEVARTWGIEIRV